MKKQKISLSKQVKKMKAPKVWDDKAQAFVEVGPQQAYNMNHDKAQKRLDFKDAVKRRKL